MKHVYSCLLILLVILKTSAQEKIDFKDSVVKIDSFVNNEEYEKARKEIYSLQSLLKNTSIGKDRLTQLYFISKLTFISHRSGNCDSLYAQGVRELALRKEIDGVAHSQTLMAKHNLGVYLLSCGLLEEAKQELLETLDIHQQYFDRVDRTLFVTLDDLAFTCGQLNQLDSAVHFYNRLLKLFDKYGQFNNFYYHVLDNYSALMFNNGSFGKAANLFEKLAAKKKQEDDYHQFLNDYYQACLHIPDYVKAIRVITELQKVCATSPDKCSGLNYDQYESTLERARLSVMLSRYDEAINYYQQLVSEEVPVEKLGILVEAAEISARAGYIHRAIAQLSHSKQLHDVNDLTDSATYTKTIFALARLYTEAGRFNEADHILNDYISSPDSKGNNNPLLKARAYLALGNQKYLTQNYKDADMNYSYAMQLLDANDLNATREYASLLNSMGALSEALASYKTAKKRYIQAFNVIQRNEIANAELEVALASNLANILLKEQPDNDSITSLLNLSIAKQQMLTGSNHPIYANLLAKKASYHQKVYQYDSAKAGYLKAAAIYDYTVGKNNHEYIAQISNLGLLYEQMDQYDTALLYNIKAKKLYEEYFTADNPGYLLLLNNLSNLYTKLNRYKEAENLYLSLAKKQVEQIKKSFTYLSENEKQNFVAERRKFLENFKRYTIARSNHGKDSVSSDLLVAWYDLELTTKGILLSSTKKVREALFQGNDKDLQNMFSQWMLLRKQIADMNSLTASAISEKANALDSLTSQIEIVEKELSRRSSGFSQSYAQSSITFDTIKNSLNADEAAIEIIKTDLETGPVYSALFVSPDMATPKLIYLGDENTLGKDGYRYYKNSMQFKVENSVPFNTFFKRVYNQLAARGIHKIYYAPDGIYHKINLGTLYNASTKKYLLEEFEIVQLTSTKEILKKNHASLKIDWDPKKASYLLVGRPDYAIGTQQIAVASSRSFSFGTINDLPGTEEEIETITEILRKDDISSIQLMHTNATENNVKNYLDNEVIHIATHGFFIDENSDSQLSFDPMLNSGLLLSGVGDARLKEETGEDGILTAYEIMNLGISKNKMVILSACETGLGEISSGEGIFGLQRAFFVAGTENIIMSLWKVDDNATRDLMVHFYKNLIKTGNKREAFFAAQKKIKKQYKDPHYWGAFIMLGI